MMQGLTELACMNCSCISLAARSTRLAQIEGRMNSLLLPAQRDSTMSPCSHMHHRAESQEAPGRGKCRNIDPLAQKVDTLVS